MLSNIAQYCSFFWAIRNIDVEFYNVIFIPIFNSSTILQQELAFFATILRIAVEGCAYDCHRRWKTCSHTWLFVTGPPTSSILRNIAQCCPSIFGVHWFCIHGVRIILAMDKDICIDSFAVNTMLVLAAALLLLRRLRKIKRYKKFFRLRADPAICWTKCLQCFYSL